jgi:hypothetical protein
MGAGISLVFFPSSGAQSSSGHEVVQVTGDSHVPAGKDTWHAQAAPIDQPWAAGEAALVDLQQQLKQDDDLGRKVIGHTS